MSSASSIEKIDANLIGIGSLIKSSRFTIPIYQRPYSWTDNQIDDLYKDLNDAIGTDAPDYFLGTIVTTRNPDENRFTIIDGQQRQGCSTLLSCV